MPASRGTEARPPLPEEAAEQLAAAGARFGDVALEGFDQRHDVLPHHGLEQVFLARVVQVERALA
ncbi:MAG TPA: hypothetical protein PK787_09160, partial [Burkholderiaceae bacterium]|nr:hypothetical protein [Burkholderiaceae bacterium]